MPAVATPLSREKLLQIARSLPADLSVLSALGEMLQDLNSELDEIAALLRRDVALAARIVRISNSPVFGGGGSIASIEEAVNRVGFGEILKLVGTATAARFTEHGLSHYDISAQRLRDNLLYGALAAESLAGPAGIDPRAAYTAGLLRPLGLMVLDRCGQGRLNWTERYATSKWPSYSAWEGGMFGIDNCEVADLILAEWRFPKEIGSALRAHHLSRPSDYEFPLACLLNVAGTLTQQAEHALAGDAPWWGVTPEKLRGAGLGMDDLPGARERTDEKFQAALSALAA